MSSKFEQVSLSPKANVLAKQAVKLAGFDCQYQKWQLDKITAESFIFVTDEIRGLSEDEIKAIVSVTKVCQTPSQIILARTESGFTFLSFNFDNKG